jgi:hypothetical protein
MAASRVLVLLGVLAILLAASPAGEWQRNRALTCAWRRIHARHVLIGAPGAAASLLATRMQPRMHGTHCPILPTPGAQR